jgi:hypothetical protein
MADHQDRPPLETREAAHQRRVIGEAPVAVQFGKVREERLDVVESIRPLRMSLGAPVICCFKASTWCRSRSISSRTTSESADC